MATVSLKQQFIETNTSGVKSALQILESEQKKVSSISFNVCERYLFFNYQLQKKRYSRIPEGLDIKYVFLVNGYLHEF